MSGADRDRFPPSLPRSDRLHSGSVPMPARPKRVTAVILAAAGNAKSEAFAALRSAAVGIATPAGVTNSRPDRGLQPRFGQIELALALAGQAVIDAPLFADTYGGFALHVD